MQQLRPVTTGATPTTGGYSVARAPVAYSQPQVVRSAAPTTSTSVRPAAAPLPVSGSVSTVVNSGSLTYAAPSTVRPATTAATTTTLPSRVVQAAAPTTKLAAAPPTSTLPTRVVQAAAPVVTSGTVLRPVSSIVVQQQPNVVTTTPHVAAGPGYTQGAYEAKHQDDPQLQNLKELKRTSGLKSVAVGEGLRTLKAASVDGKLTREQFHDAYIGLLQAQQVDLPAESVRNAVFDLFDRDDNNVVDMMELICGISLLCSGSEDDKIYAVFNVFDENSDGFISMDEMFKFLTSVFKVVLTPNVMAVMNSMGVTVESAEDLASVTVLECFKTADLNHDGKLSIAEFKSWFYAPRNDPSFLFSPVRKLLQ